GHDGSLTTAGPTHPVECLSRIEMMVLLAGLHRPLHAVRQQLTSAIHVIVQATRLSDGTRKVLKITEMVGMEGEAIQMQDIFEFAQTSIDARGAVRGHFRTTGFRSRYFERLVAAG